MFIYLVLLMYRDNKVQGVCTKKVSCDNVQMKVKLERDESSDDNNECTNYENYYI